MATPDFAELVDTDVEQLSRLVLSEETLDSCLRRIAELASSAVPACDTCGLTLLTNGAFHTAAAHDSTATRLDRYQYEANEGPCLDAIRTVAPCGSNSLREEIRWPHFVQRARIEELTSCYCVPLRVRGATLGAVNLYSFSEPFSVPDQRLARRYADQASSLLTNVLAFEESRLLVEQLNDALQSRDLIGQAKGIIMERERCGPEEAFAILRATSQKSNIKLRDFAAHVVRSVASRPGGVHE
jgi:GAF domain-containing protein